MVAVSGEIAFRPITAKRDLASDLERVLTTEQVA
jgi:hypothetical protein